MEMETSHKIHVSDFVVMNKLWCIIKYNSVYDCFGQWTWCTYLYKILNFEFLLKKFKRVLIAIITLASRQRRPINIKIWKMNGNYRFN